MADSENQQQKEDVAASDDHRILENGKNKTNIYCQHCPSLVLSINQAKKVETEFVLPHMFKKRVESEPDEGETLRDYWMVEDMFTFDNVGFTNSVGTIKYLICADCEIGPIGWHDSTNKKRFYIALDRVKHQ
ncbi:guanine nucleotide exchange factor MSS4-like [Gigantopelta aegis]|uniref:guanine nucleotide exchange factor MSS4-like n=1 Tax=Gigantopelta aegis TaxID=1735272 RepID=UPI001B88DBF8|nr:guanine nucleotide exchange factor MSS4-like [Gigantopelta aegis]